MLYSNKDWALNGICPYFTMFPAEFPYSILTDRAEPGEWVLDPFCGRGTTNFAARLVGLASVGIDSSPVATAITQAKLANTSPTEIIAAAREVLDQITQPREVPEGEFWDWAFAPDVLHTVCRLREGLLLHCDDHARQALRAILLGALHGPKPKFKASYLSNQSPRTYAPKPAYAVRFWKEKGLQPETVDVLKIIQERAERYYTPDTPPAHGKASQGDSRDELALSSAMGSNKASWVITSPPYYGLRTYIPDQWLRIWLVGGSAKVDYSVAGQIQHTSPEVFSTELRTVWRNVSQFCTPHAQLVIRFGGIRYRKAEPLTLLLESLRDSGWSIKTITSSGSALQGRRQARHFFRAQREPYEEHDVWAQKGVTQKSNFNLTRRQGGE